jgi:hypothetical protein
VLIVIVISHSKVIFYVDRVVLGILFTNNQFVLYLVWLLTIWLYLNHVHAHFQKLRNASKAYCSYTPCLILFCISVFCIVFNFLQYKMREMIHQLLLVDHWLNIKFWHTIIRFSRCEQFKQIAYHVMVLNTFWEGEFFKIIT